MPGGSGPQSWCWWCLNAGQIQISWTNLGENHVKISENPAKNDQEQCLCQTQTACDRLCVTDTDCLCTAQPSVENKDGLLINRPCAVKYHQGADPWLVRNCT